MTGFSLAPQPKQTIESTPSSVFAAKVSRTDPIMVTLDAYGETHEWGPVTWLGDGIPARGDRCLALRDDYGAVWAAPDGVAFGDLVGRVTSLESDSAATTPYVAVIKEAPLNVEWPEYGADPLATATANAAAIQAAADALPDGGTAIVPRAYPTNATIEAAAGRILQGVGLGSAIEYSGSGTAVLLGSNTLSVDDPNTGGGVRDLLITGTAGGDEAIRMRGITRWLIENVRIQDFTAGDAIKAHGASFIGEIRGGRLQNCLRGISAKKQAGFGDAGEGCALNGVEIHGGLEIQGCGTAIEIGDPTTTETGAVVGIGIEIHGIVVENNTQGIWNVGGNVVHIHSSYFEDNGSFDIRLGSISGNTSIPVLCTIGANFINPKTGGIAIHVLRGLHTRINPNYILGVPADTTSGVVLAAGAASTVTLPQFCNSIDTEYSDAGIGNVRETLETDGVKHNMGFRTTGTLNAGGYVQSYEGTTAALLMGNASGQAALYWGDTQDVVLKRIQAGVLGGITGMQFASMASGTAPNNSIFRDSADNVIKVKNNSGVVTAI
jgi:hypothetical protein